MASIKNVNNLRNLIKQPTSQNDSQEQLDLKKISRDEIEHIQELMPSFSRICSADISSIQNGSQIHQYPNNNSVAYEGEVILKHNQLDQALREGEKLRQGIFLKQDSQLKMVHQQGEGAQSVHDFPSDYMSGKISDEDDDNDPTYKYGIQQEDENPNKRVHSIRVLGKEKTKKSNMKKSTYGPQVESQFEYNQSVSNFPSSPPGADSQQIKRGNDFSECGTKVTQRVLFQDMSSNLGLSRYNQFQGRNINTEGYETSSNQQTSRLNNHLGISQLNNNISNINNNTFSVHLNNNENTNNNLNDNQGHQEFNEIKKLRMNRISILKDNVNKISFKLFKRVNLVKKFTQQLVGILPSRMIDKLSHLHYNIINDISYYRNNNSNNRHLTISTAGEQHHFFRQLLTPFKSSFSQKQAISLSNSQSSSSSSSLFLNFLNSSFSIFLPNNNIQVFIQLCLLIALAIILLVTPVLVAFEQSRENKFFMIITEPVALGVFCIQLLLSLNTGYYQEGEIVKSRLLILSRYLKSTFILDAFSIVLFIIAINYGSMQYLKLIIFLKISQLLEMLNGIEEHFQLQQKYYTIFELTKLYILVFFVAHCSGSIFYSISTYEYNHNQNQESWLKKQNIDQQDYNVQYLTSLYFSFITMITVGYGDIVPITSNERIYVIFFTIVSCGIFAYSVNTIGSIFQELSQKQANYKLKKFEISKYMQRRNIQRVSQIKVLKYLEYMNTQEEERIYLQKGEQILSNISKNLREEVMRDFFGKILQESQMFKIFSKKIINQLSLLMKEVTLGPGDIIFNKGDIDTKLYYVFKGQVEYLLEQENNIIKFGIYNIGDFFGQDGFFTETARQYTTKSKGTTHIVSCKREDIIKLINESSLDMEAFSLIKDEMMFKQQYQGQKCLLCGKNTHVEIKCDLVNLRINRPLLILKNNYSIEQKRQINGYQRNKTYKISTYSINQIVKKHLKQFRTTCVLEALENWDDLNILQENHIGDKDFFLRLPKIKVNEAGNLVQDTEESVFSDEDLDLLSKSEQIDTKDSDMTSDATDQQQFQLHQQQQIKRQTVRMASRKHTTNNMIKKQNSFEEVNDWNQMFRQKTRGESFIGSNQQLTKKQLLNYEQSEDEDTSTVGLDQVLRNEKRQHTNITNKTAKTSKTLQRADSQISIKSHQNEFNRNASRNLSHFGATAAGVALPNPIVQKEVPSGLMPQKGDSILKNNINSNNNNNVGGVYVEQMDYEFDLMKEYAVYYPTNNLSSILRQLKKNWIDQYQKKRYKTKGSQKNTQKNNPKMQKSETYKTIKTSKTSKTSKSQKIDLIDSQLQ